MATDDKRKWTEQSAMHANLVLSSVVKIAAAANVELSKATIAIYVERLGKLSSERIRQATTRTIDDWREASKMPPLSFIIERSYLGREAQEVIDDAPRVLSRLALPGHIETRSERFAFSAELIAEMRSKLGANAMPPAQMPNDPEQRRTWATDMARKQGWI